IHIVDSMFNQHAKWLKVTRAIPWRQPIASLNYLLSSHVWRQDHNGFSHQDPGFIDHVVNKKAEIIRVYLPPDANTLLSVADHCLRSRDYVNVIVAGNQPELNYLGMDAAIVHYTRRAGIWEWASTADDGYPDAVLGCCDATPTPCTCAATRRRARPRRRSTWSCSTTSTASISRSTSSTACRGSRRSMGACGTSWRTAASAPAPTRASTARTTPRSATGP